MTLSDLARRRLAVAGIALLLASTGGHHRAATVQVAGETGRVWQASAKDSAIELGVTGVRLLARWAAGQLR